MKTYGYCRISTGKQNIDRQIRNIKDEYPEAMIVEEIYTGTKMEEKRTSDKGTESFLTLSAVCRGMRKKDSQLMRNYIMVGLIWYF